MDDSIVKNEPTVTIPLSLYNEIFKIYIKYQRNQNVFYPYFIPNPDPVPFDYLRPGDWPFGPKIWC